MIVSGCSPAAGPSPANPATKSDAVTASIEVRPSEGAGATPEPRAAASARKMREENPKPLPDILESGVPAELEKIQKQAQDLFSAESALSTSPSR